MSPRLTLSYGWRLVIMAKEPVMGRIKTRLASEAGQAEAIRFYRQTMQAVMGRLGRDARWGTILAVTPDTGLASGAWPRHSTMIGQGRGDLGTRMQRLFDRLPPGPVVIVGTDIPAIRPAIIAKAFRLLGSHDAVFGPAKDGGYWLVGLKRRPHVPRPFSGVRWSSRHALGDTRARLGSARVANVATLEDVDGLADLERAGAGFARRIRPAAADRQVYDPNRPG
jgi:hypothetical protein